MEEIAVEYYDDEELARMSPEEIKDESRRMLLTILCTLNLQESIRSLEEGESSLQDYEDLLELFEPMLTPEYFTIAKEVHSEVYRDIAGKGIEGIIGWS